MDKFESNSLKSQQIRALNESENANEKHHKVVTAPVEIRKNGVRRIRDEIISEEASVVKDRVMTEVVFPAIKNLIVDMVTSFVSMTFGGNARLSQPYYDKPYTSSLRSPYYQPNGYYNQQQPYKRPICDEIRLASRRDAEEVLLNMNDTIHRYGKVRIADLYEFVGIDDNNYTNNDWGWYNISTATITSVRGGWLLRLPKPQSLTY